MSSSKKYPKTVLVEIPDRELMVYRDVNEYGEETGEGNFEATVALYEFKGMVTLTRGVVMTPVQARKT